MIIGGKMDRREIFLLLADRFKEQIEVSKRRAVESQKEANFHKGAMVSRYDTFKEEAQDRVAESEKRTAELIQELMILLRFIDGLNDFVLADYIQMGNIVVVARDNNEVSYLISPVGGGWKIKYNNRELIVITLKAPLCKKIFKQKVAYQFSLKNRGVKKNFKVIKII